MIAGTALLVASLALCVSLGQLVYDLLKHPRPDHGREVEDPSAIIRPDLSDDTVQLPRAGKRYRGRYRRRG